MFFRTTCAVSRYNLSRSQKTVKMQDLDCVQVRVSGCKFWQDLSWEQGAAKTMTNNLPILSVLCVDFYLVSIDLSIKYFINSVAAVKAGLAKGSLNNISIGPSPKYNPSETRNVILTLPLVG